MPNDGEKTDLAAGAVDLLGHGPARCFVTFD
jgi:hypothetical protein